MARDHALAVRGKESTGDIEQVDVLLRAALQLNPQQIDAHRLLEELAEWRGDAVEARTHLEAIVTLDPGNQGAFARWLSAGLAGIQTAEARKRWLQSLLAVTPPRPRDQQSMIYVELARLALEGMQRAQARLALDRALGLDDQNPDAAELSLELLAADAPPHAQLKAILRALRASPLRTDLATLAASLLDAYGFSTEAAVLFDHVLEVARSRGASVTPAFMYERAQNLLAVGKPADALTAVEQAAKADPDLLEAHFLYCWLLARQGRGPDAENVRSALSRRFAEIREPADWNVNDVAQAAWFYCTLDPQPQRALMLAESAARRAEKDVFAQRVLGWAQAQSGRLDEAQRTLMPIAGKDAWACYRLAKLLKEAGDADAPQRLAANLEIMPVAGPAYEALMELGPLGPATQPAGRRFPELAQQFADFDREVLSFQKSVGRYLEAELRVENPGLGVGEPWWVWYSLTNRGRFPITLGDSGMVNPVFVVSIKMDGDRARDYPQIFTERLDRVQVLAPGQTIRVRRTLDVGPPGRAAKQSPQQLQRVSVTAILDPAVDEKGNCVPAATGQKLRPVFFNRVPATTNREALHALFAAVSGQSDAARFQALEIMAQLLGERHRDELKQLSYRPSPVPVDQIYQTLSGALTAEQWEVRARTLYALQFAGLDANLVRAAHTCLEDPNWVVRLFALRLLARQGAGFAPTCQRVADGDTDELVRDLARAYLDTWGIAPPEPTAGPASQPMIVPESSEPVPGYPVPPGRKDAAPRGSTPGRGEPPLPQPGALPPPPVSAPLPPTGSPPREGGVPPRDGGQPRGPFNGRPVPSAGAPTQPPPASAPTSNPPAPSPAPASPPRPAAPSGAGGAPPGGPAPSGGAKPSLPDDPDLRGLLDPPKPAAATKPAP